MTKAARLDCTDGNRTQALAAVAFADYLDAEFTGAPYGSERARILAIGLSSREAQLLALSMRLLNPRVVKVDVLPQL